MPRSRASGLQPMRSGFKDLNIVGFAGDGGTADIGLQSLSGMLERRTNAIYVMYDNEAYMNTGVQRSGATPAGAWTTTTPVVGRPGHGKSEAKKDMMGIVLAHHPALRGHAQSELPRGLRCGRSSRHARLTGRGSSTLYRRARRGGGTLPSRRLPSGDWPPTRGLFPLYEVEDGKYHIARKGGALKPVADYFHQQGRFGHLTDQDIALIQQRVLGDWARLQALEKAS